MLLALIYGEWRRNANNARRAAPRTPIFMRRRLRKLTGTLLLLAFLGVYATTAMLVAQSEPVHQASGWVQALFFGIVGLAWVLPLLPLISWMERPDAGDVTRN